LSLAGWAADGLLAIFFFVAGLELKREFVAGDLRDPRRAALPVAAAVGGMAVPALVFVLVNLGTDALRGWAVPTATDILLGSLIAALLAAVVLRVRNRHYRRLYAEEAADADADGVPDVYQRDDGMQG
jgi:Na+/H+ antiporter NhaA